MPEVVPQRNPTKLTAVERLRKHIRDELDLARFHQRRADEANQRAASYATELAKHTGSDVK